LRWSQDELGPHRQLHDQHDRAQIPEPPPPQFEQVALQSTM